LQKKDLRLPHSSDQSRQALVGDIGRTSVRLGLTDESGSLCPDSVRSYDVARDASIPNIIGRFAGDAGLRSFPRRCAIAISGVPRGDAIPVTNSRIILSRPELTKLLGTPPLILNDFAANSWAISSESCSGRVEALNGTVVTPYQPGSYCVIGVGSGLGVALLTRDQFGVVNVIPSEAGHMGFMAGMPEADAILALVLAQRGHVSAEALLSKPGLIATYQALAKIRGIGVLCVPDLLKPNAAKNDPLAAEAQQVFAQALWHFAGNMVLAYGAWDGVILTGSVVAALRPALRRLDAAHAFVVAGPYRDRLRDVPRSTVSFEYAELEGAAVALTHEDERLAQQASAPLVLDAARRRARKGGPRRLSVVSA
jgi:glucokinase